MLTTLSRNALYGLHLRDDFRAERVVYVPCVGGPEVEITAGVFDQPAQQEVGPNAVSFVEVANFLIGANPAHATKGGVAKPAVGDALYRVSEGPSFKYGVMAVDSNDGGWWVTASRESLVSIGQQRR